MAEQSLKATPSKVSGDSPNGGGGFDYIAEPLRGLALPISSINQDAANARKHDARNIDAIASSLKRWGQRLPIVVQREGMIVRAGNGRVDAARSLGWSHLAAVVVDEDSVEATAYAIADNRTAELAEWDNETLRSLLDSLDSDLRGVIAFSDSEIETLIPELLQSTPVSEIDCEAFNGQHKCPKCGFEFDD